MWRQVGRLVLAMMLGNGVLVIMAASSHASSRAASHAPPTPTPDPSTDGRAVYCLKSENARPLVDAAISLGLARKGADDERLKAPSGATGRDLTVRQWAQAHPADFRRACAALAVERKLPAAPSGSWWKQLPATVTGAVPVVLGALLALASTMLTTGRAERRRTADDLHAAVTAHHRACHACLVAWRNGRGRALEKDMDAPLDALRAQLHRCASRHPRWRKPRSLGDALERLDQDIRETRWPSDEEARTARANDYLDRLEAARAEASSITTALERPLRNRRKMRAP